MLYKPEPTPEQKKRMFYIGELKSEQCQCERPKQRGRAVCYKCWLRLPDNLRHALYRPVGGGFEQAYEEAYRYLNDL